MTVDARIADWKVGPARPAGRLGLWSRNVLRLFASDVSLMIGGITCLILLFTITIAPLLIPHDPQATTADVLMPPSAQHLLGTDSVGRDQMARLVLAARSSIFIAVAATFLTMLIGTAIGMTAGFFRGYVDWIGMRIVDVLLSLPPLLVSITVLAALGPSIPALLTVLTVTYFPQTVRLVRASTLQISRREYVDSARISGVSAFRNIVVHILPNVRGILIVQATVTVAQLMLIETILSFLGLGVQPPTPNLGFMVSEGRQWMEFAPWVVLAPGLAIVFTVAAFTFLGHGLDRALTNRS